MQVKICGITTINDALLCCELGANAIGFIFYEKSKRYINYGKAAEIIHQLPPFIVKVGIFVNPILPDVNEIAQSVGLNAVQLHGDELQTFVEQINFPVIKGFRINNEFEYSKLDNYKNCSFLLDSYTPNNPGGTGITFDWSMIPSKFRDKIILAGGISSENIEYIYKNVQPMAIDLSSSVESSPGKKDPIKLREFFKIVNKLRYSC